MLFKPFLTRPYIFWPLVKLFCLRGEEFVWERKTATNFPDLKYRLGDTLSQISFFLPSLSLSAWLIFHFRTLSSPIFFSDFCLCTQVMPRCQFLPPYVSIPLPYLGGVTHFPFAAPAACGCMEEIAPFFLCDWQAGWVRYEEEQKHLSYEDPWHPCAWVPALAAVMPL